MSELPTVTIVFLVYNRREELRDSLQRMTGESDYPARARGRHRRGQRVGGRRVGHAPAGVPGRAADPARGEHRRERLERRARGRDGRLGAAARRRLLPAPGRPAPRRDAAHEHEADFVSFAVTSSEEPDHRFDFQYRTGLLAFWGCAALTRKAVLERIGGYDPDIFVWANEVEFMLRFYDAGFRHLHAPEIEAVHMKEVRRGWGPGVGRLGLPDALQERRRTWRASTCASSRRSGRSRRSSRRTSRRPARQRPRAGRDPDVARRLPARPAQPPAGPARHLARLPAALHQLREPVVGLAPAAPVPAGHPGRAGPAGARGRRAKQPGTRWPEFYARSARYYPDSAATLEF